LTVSRQRRPPRGRRALKVVAALLAFAAAFVVGIGVGEALHDNPKPGGEQTLVRTLRPLPLVPVARGTVTVTTTVR
jgi:hypothetical protein